MPKIRQSQDIAIRTYAFGHTGGYTIPPHRHDWSQLIYASAGVMTVRAGLGVWVVPPERGVWVPANVTHSIQMSGAVSVRTLYFATGFARRRLPTSCAVVNVSPLLRELILHPTRIGALDRGVTAHRRLIDVMLDQMQTWSQAPLELAMPRDAQALKAAEILRARPGSAGSLQRVARSAGASLRTLERRFRAETGMGLGRWRQQLRLLHGLRLLAEGESVTNVALDAGYRSTSAFISMFKKALGATPFRYRGAR